jgi:hypothetical protein
LKRYAPTAPIVKLMTKSALLRLNACAVAAKESWVVMTMWNPNEVRHAAARTPVSNQFFLLSDQILCAILKTKEPRMAAD